MSAIYFRIEPDKLAAINHACHAAGMNRSAWLKMLIERELQGASAARPAIVKSDDEHRRYVKLRMNRRQYAALAAMAQNCGIYVSDAAKKIIFARLYDGELIPVQTMAALQSLNDLKNEIRRIGININQSARALQASLKPDSGIRLETAISSLLPFLDQLTVQLTQIKNHISDTAKCDYRYWRGDPDASDASMAALTK